MTRADATLDAYLARVDAALARLPADERRDILAETRSHVLDQTSRTPPRSVADALAELGDPESYARRFLADAPTTQPGVLRGLARLADGGWRSYPLLALVVVAYGVAGVALLFVVAELVDPFGTGLMIGALRGGGRYVNLVMSGSPDPRGDVLGRWFAPLMLLLAALIHLGVRALLRRASRRTA